MIAPSLRHTAAILAATALFGTTAGAATLPGKVLQSATINGFTVNLRAFPTTATLHRPTSTYGAVTIGRNSVGSSPYAGTPLAGSPFITMEGGGNVNYTLKAPAASIAFIWGTPDPYNVVELFDTANNYIGVVTGGDIVKAFPGQVTQAKGSTYMQIVSPTPIGYVSAFSEDCCFEIANPTAMYSTSE